ncbi:hypothetical protein [Mycolicibacterium holsaticum]|uniref:hypothetical protein n=1 Tax=Mycolicibacterium holsaticum TaxID=152142 RepID=UPI001C7E088A|nr:hypothetical protein [Mycolicibacterium holsaticum]QZA11524.1 hypothetical protein K3U96_20310 [Mycolicibacterium holsaticum DSM 44478 = JCM 12374]UNC10988.1 hypothetical protein H5U41_06520 [Mycolicibacterium holsaticum DSM 44478 = JCM 12374]
MAEKMPTHPDVLTAGAQRGVAATRPRRILLRLVIVSLVALGTPLLPAPVSGGEPLPDTARAQPYPELRYFTEIDSAPYNLAPTPGVSLPEQPGYWFTTAQGLNCGIWFRGSFGCSGDIPGAPAGVHQIGWITGDTKAHYDWTLAVRFPQGPRGSAAIPPLSFIDVEGTKCATTVDYDTYCERGPARFLITATHTWLS